MKKIIILSVILAGLTFSGVVFADTINLPIAKLFITLNDSFKSPVYKVVDYDSGATCYIVSHSISCVK